MFALVQAAYTHHQLLVAPPAAYAFAPRDAVVAAYPPLAQMMYYSMTAIGGPVLNCAQSALLLARTRLFQVEDDKAQAASKPRPVAQAPAEIAAAAAGFTRMQMVRFLSHNGMRHFPVYEYEVATDSFTLIAGKPRDDQHAIVYVPADGPAFPVAHWTYGGVEHVDTPLRRLDPAFHYVVYTEFYVSHPMVYWRARVTDANLPMYQIERAAGRACDCIWDGICEHERGFRQANPISRRVTLDGHWHVEGTMFACIVGSTDPAHRVTRTERDGVKQRITGTNFVQRDNIRPGCAVGRASTISNKWDSLFRTNDAADVLDLGLEYIHPLKLQVFEFRDEAQIREIGMPNVGRMVLLKLVKNQKCNYLTELSIRYSAPDWASDADLNLRFPRKKELLGRLAAKNELTRDNVLDVLRRMAAEEKWDVDFEREELKIWLSRVVTEVGMATILEPGACLNCCTKAKTYRRMCRTCKRRGREVLPEPLPTADALVVYVGRRPLWSHAFEIPQVMLKKDAKIYYRKKLIYPNAGISYDQLVARFRRDVAPRTQRGYSAGPVFLSQEPSCYPRGVGTACMAFLVRLGVQRLHTARSWFYDLCYEYLVSRGLEVIEPETTAQYLAHLRGEKLAKNLEAALDIASGWLPTQTRTGEVRVPMTGFPKAEKAMAYVYDPAPALLEKGPMKPRFICCPSPMMLVVTGRYTHAQTKWLARTFTWRDNMYYAGCSTPEELNCWLNRTLEMVPDPYSIVDDISAMDSNHSMESFGYHAKVRRHQFPHISAYMEAAFRGEEQLSVKVGMYTLAVEFVNASGVTDTSYKNSLICLVVRVFATMHGFFDISALGVQESIAKADEMLRVVATTASGDDGLTRVPAVVLGVPIEKFSLARYREVWSWAGFDVKVFVVPPNRWRMATFLAMRPVWAGHRYEWAPEPARRMRGLFWQIDNELHHVSWARGVASQVLLQSRHLPVLSDICEWFLEITEGPRMESKRVDRHVNYHSPFFGYKTSGTLNPRSVAEFCVDYHITEACYEEFRALLRYVRTPYVNFNGHIFHRIFQEES